MYSTTNFHLACCLICSDQKIERVDKSDPRAIKVLFDDSTKLREIIESYWNGTLMIPALRHNQEYKTLMDRIND